MKKTSWKGILALSFATLIWGTAFVAQKEGLSYVGPFTFNGIRTLLGSLALLPVLLFLDLKVRKTGTDTEKRERKKVKIHSLAAGIPIGISLCVASNLQQVALVSSAPGKVAFLTALYLFFVPLIGLLFKKKISWALWICIGIGAVGMYFLCINPAENSGFQLGDLLAIGCGITYAVQILLIEKMSATSDCVILSFSEFLTSAILTTIIMFLFEEPQMPAILDAHFELLYAGIMSIGIAYTLQIIGQKHVEASVASLIMCMESVVAVISTAILLQSVPTGRELLGSILLFASIVLSQLLPIFAEKRKKTVG